MNPRFSYCLVYMYIAVSVRWDCNLMVCHYDYYLCQFSMYKHSWGVGVAVDSPWADLDCGQPPSQMRTVAMKSFGFMQQAREPIAYELPTNWGFAVSQGPHLPRGLYVRPRRPGKIMLSLRQPSHDYRDQNLEKPKKTVFLLCFCFLTV